MEERRKYFSGLEYRASEELPKLNSSILWAAQANTAVVAFLPCFYFARS